MCCLNMGLNLKIPKMSPALCMTLYTESVVDQTDHFADVLLAKTLRTVMTL